MITTVLWLLARVSNAECGCGAGSGYGCPNCGGCFCNGPCGCGR